MSKPLNGAARNTMSEFERQCYDWGWQDNEQRIIKLLEGQTHYRLQVEEVDQDAILLWDAIALIKGEGENK